jgi:hypothetical protein
LLLVILTSLSALPPHPSASSADEGDSDEERSFLPQEAQAQSTSSISTVSDKENSSIQPKGRTKSSDSTK